MSQSVNLVLKSSQINPVNTVATYYNQTIDNQFGTVSNNRSSLTWKNINMRTLLGDMYDKYDRFNINLNFIAGAATGSTAETIPDNRMFQVKLSGLPFTSSYNEPTQTNIGTVCLTTVQVPLTAATTWYNNFLSQQYFTFLKQDFVNLTIDLHTIVGDTSYAPIANSYMIGHVVLSLNIFGVDNFNNLKDSTIHRFDLHPTN